MTPLDRIKAFLRETDERVCDEGRTTPHGVALLTPSLPLVWQLNAIRVEDREATAADLVAEADELLAAGAPPQLVVHDEEVGARLAPALTAQGWNAFRLLVMVQRRPPDHPSEGGLAAEVRREHGRGADARLHESRGARAHPGERRDVVLVALAGGAVAQG